MIDFERMINEFEMSEDDLNEIVEFFNMYRMVPLPAGVSKDDLPVCITKFGAMLEDMGFCFTESELLSLIRQLDPDRLGYIELSNFLKNGAKPLFENSKITEDTAREVFNLIDLDRDMMVTLEDLKRTMKMFREELPNYYIKEMMKEVDIDGDDMISYDEFLFFTTGIVQ